MKPRFIQIISILLLCISGCATYHVEPSNVGVEQAVSNIDTLMINHARRWDTGPKDKAGADRNFFRYAQEVGMDVDGYHGYIFTRRYSEIQDVTVTFNPGFIVAIGIMDPTGACTVNLKYKDYTQSSFCCNGFVSFFPFYLFSPNWIQVNKAAKAFEELRARRAND